MAVMRDRPYCQFNFLVDLGDGNTDGPQRRLPGSERDRDRGRGHRVPQRQLEGKQRDQDHRPEQGDRRDDEARRHRRARPLRVARRHPQRQPERAAHRHDPAAERGPHARSCRPGSCCARASSSTPAARSTPRAATSPWKRSSSPTSGSRSSSAVAEQRDRPHGNSNFVVEFGSGASRSGRTGFAEVDLSAVRDRRATGAGAAPRPRRATLRGERRGAAAARPAPRRHRRARPLRLVGPGAPRPGAARGASMNVKLLAEDHATVVWTWRFATSGR